jgi:hypothetical protein
MICARPASVFFGSKAIVFSAIIIAITFFAAEVRAQVSGFGRTSAPTVGGTGGLPAPPNNPFSTIKGNFIPPHRTPNGQSCITVNPSVVAQAGNANIVNHMVLVGNICGQTIKVQVCYYQSSGCIVVTVNGYQKLSRTLGISSGTKDFRYEFRELL